ncbi:hypothetical protein BT93_B2052 [Corymbia citriodora subsp. variegata]|nr:hypothetical protein BT93_B2052 [Corymbia citriodora subsp. variegata]
MASSEACALLLLVFTASAALLLSSAVDAVCVPRKPHSLSPKRLPQTAATYKRPTSGPLASLFASRAALPVNRTVVDICRQTDYPDLCISSASARLKGPANALSVLTAEIEACTEKTKSAAAEADRLAADPSASRSDKMALDACKENYDSALDSLSNAKEAVAARDAGTLNSELSAVITFVGTCDDAFDETCTASPLAGANRILQHLGSNCLAIAAQAHL